MYISRQTKPYCKLAEDKTEDIQRVSEGVHHIDGLRKGSVCGRHGFKGSMQQMLYLVTKSFQ